MKAKARERRTARTTAKGRRDLGAATIRVRLTGRNWLYIDLQARAYLGRGGTDPAFTFLPNLCATIEEKTRRMFDDSTPIDVKGSYALWCGLVRFLGEQVHAYGLCAFLTRGLSRAREKIEAVSKPDDVAAEGAGDALGEVGD